MAYPRWLKRWKNMVSEEAVIEKLKSIIDPHTGSSLYDMDLISELKVAEATVSLTFTPSSPYCPIGVRLAKAIKDGIESLGGVQARVLVRGHVQAEYINQILAQGA